MHHLRKGLLTTAIIGAMGLSANAAAESEVYGKLHISWGSTQEDVIDPLTLLPTSRSSIQTSSHASRIGFKASKEVDMDLTIGAKVEWEVDVDNDATLLKGRNSFLSLKGGFGELRVGNHDTPHKMSTASLDPFTDTFADYNNIIQSNTRAENSMMYLGGVGDLKFALAYSGGANDDASAENLGAVTSGSVTYKSGPLMLTAAIENTADALPGDLESAPVIGLSYAFGPATVGLAYGKQSFASGVGVNPDDITESYASVIYKMSDVTSLRAAYGSRDTQPNSEVMMAVGLNRALDKKAELYVLAARGSDGGLAHKGKLSGDGSAFVLGGIYKF